MLLSSIQPMYFKRYFSSIVNHELVYKSTFKINSYAKSQIFLCLNPIFIRNAFIGHRRTPS